MLLEEFDCLIEKTAETIKEHYKTRLVAIVLFGSCSRRTQHYHSDIDMLIILSECEKGKMARQTEFIENIDNKLEEDFNKLTQSNIHTKISPVVKTKNEIEQGHLLLYEMTECCQIMYDPTLFMTHFLDEMKEKMKLAGVKKTSQGYWIMPEDIFPQQSREKRNE